MIKTVFLLRLFAVYYYIMVYGMPAKGCRVMDSNCREYRVTRQRGSSSAEAPPGDHILSWLYYLLHRMSITCGRAFDCRYYYSQPTYSTLISSS